MLFGIGLLQLFLYVQLLAIRNFAADIVEYLTVFFEIFVAYLAASILSLKITGDLQKTTSRQIIVLVLAFSVSFRLLMILTPATLSKDILRFAWDGRVFGHGIDPYAYRPAASELDWLKKVPYFEDYDHKNEISPYPPVAQLFFLSVNLLSGSLLGFKVAATVLDVANCLLLVYLLDKVSPRRLISGLVLYSWSPLLIVEFSSSGHMDSLPIFCILTSLTLLAKTRFLSSAVSYSLAVWSRIYPVLLLPLYLRHLRNRGDQSLVSRCLFVFSIVSIALLILSVFSSGLNLFLGQIRYASAWFYNPSIFLLLEIALGGLSAQMGVPNSLARVLVLFIFLVLSIFVYRKRPRDLGELAYYSVLILGLGLLLAPTVFPWYVSWLLAFCSIAGLNSRTLPWIVLSGTVNLGYLLQFMKGADIVQVTLIEYLPVYLMLAVAYLPRCVRDWIR